MPVLGDVDDSLHLPVPFMNSLNQTDPATFSVSLLWAIFKSSILFIFYQNPKVDLIWLVIASDD